MAALTNTYQVFDQLNRWSGQDIGKLREGFKTLPDDKKQDIARMVAKSSWHTPIAPSFAGDTIRYLVENPPANESGGNVDPVSASSIHAVNLVLQDPAAATEWVNTLPDGKAKTQALKNMATNWNQYDPKAVRDWLGTLPAGTRDEVKAHLAGKR